LGVAKRKPVRVSRAERNINWIEDHCHVPEGKLGGQPARLREWQRDIVRLIYDNPHGTRQAIISFPRKNGKTAFVAFLLLLHLCGPEAVPNSQLYSAAVSQDQAATIYKLAAKMVRMSPLLSGFVVARDTLKQLACPELGTVYGALSAEKKTAHGKSPIFAVHDELGQIKGPVSELYEAVETGMGAHNEPLSIIISTQAPTDSDLLSKLIDYAKTGEDPKTVLSLFSAPADADPWDEATLKACNPAWGDFLNADEVMRTMRNAKAMPSREPEYRNLHLNQRVNASAPFISKSVFDSCLGDVVKDLDGRVVFAGLDLSLVADLTAFVAVTPVDGVWHTVPTFWLPGKGLTEKAKVDRVPYDIWARQGFLNTTPGPTVDYEFVAEWLWQFCSKADVQKIAFDAWGFPYLKPWLAKCGFAEDQLEGDSALFQPMRQGMKTMSPALRDLESAFLNQKILHDGHPILEMCAKNATTTGDAAGNRMLSKEDSHGRIDGMVALAMAMSVAGTWQESGYAATPWDADPEYRLEL
jgi:phage terminase large subunit-like protein